MKCLRSVMAGVVGSVISFGLGVTLGGCGDSTTGTQVNESVESKKENDRTTDAMRNAMQQKAGPKGTKGSSR